MIDTAYYGEVSSVVLSDVPERKDDLVSGSARWLRHRPKPRLRSRSPTCWAKECSSLARYSVGMQFTAVCRACGTSFTGKSGGGFTFHMLHCDRCGRSREIEFEKLGDLHYRFLKGLRGPYAIATSEHDQMVREHFPGEPLSEPEYHSAVEGLLPKCRCGGAFRFDAPIRCPKCRSDQFEEDPDGDMLMYD